MSRSAQDLINFNDFEGCLERWKESNARWKNHWFDALTTIYNNSKEWAKKYILDPIKQTVEAVKKKICQKFNNDSIIFENCEPFLQDGIEQFYILELLDKNGNLVWSKVGTTTRATLKRMREHKTYYKDIATIKVLKIWDCGEQPAECYESFFRAYYIRKYPGTFNKNDRFTNVKLDLNEAEQLFQQWKNFEIPLLA